MPLTGGYTVQPGMYVTNPGNGTVTGGLGIQNGTLNNIGTVIGTPGTYSGISGINTVGGAGGFGVSAVGGTLLNSGTIVGGHGGQGAHYVLDSSGGAGGYGVTLSAGASLTNTGLILGGSAGHHLGPGGGGPYAQGGVGVAGTTVSVTNLGGTIMGNTALGAGVVLTNGTLSNTGLIKGLGSGDGLGGSPGVLMTGGTIINGGTIVGGYNFLSHARYGAVGFSGTVASRLVVEAGATFVGEVSTSDPNTTLELGSTSGTGTLAGIGTSFAGFSKIQFDPGESWSISGGANGLETAGVEINGFASGDTIEVTGVSATGYSFSDNVLTLTNAGSLAIIGPYSTSNFHVSTASGDTFVTMTCFRDGTRIATVEGPVPVESLRCGDHVMAHDGDGAPPTSRRIRWVGHRRIDCSNHPRPEAVWPVRIRAHAFGPGQPSRDLFLSPDHAVCFEGGLIPIRHLINGDSVARVAVARVTYYHIELKQHAVLLAEGMSVESYLDLGDRWKFRDGNGPGRRVPNGIEHVREAFACLPLIAAGPRLRNARVSLERAAPVTAG
jgi:collagen type I/II/III/V/XI/XXIV/XXVII alpha